jgi:cytochrome P450
VRFNHLSNGTQYCPGAGLVSLIGKAAIAHTLTRLDLELEQPSLPAGGDLPHMLDFYDVKFRARARQRTTA